MRSDEALDRLRSLMTDANDRDYERMAQLSCRFAFPVTQEARALGHGALWSMTLPLEDFWTRAMALPGFHWVLSATPTPTALSVHYGDV